MSRLARTWALTAVVSSAAGGATSRAGAAATPSVATAQAVTGQTTTNAMLWDAQQTRDDSAATGRRSALIAVEMISRSAAGARRRPKLAKRRGRAGGWDYQDELPREKL